jgi:hypothetical protein
MDFWCHVVQGTKLGVEVATSISTLNWGSKSKICNLEGIGLVKEKILWLEISVSKPVLMAVVKTMHELLEIISSNWLLEPS